MVTALIGVLGVVLGAVVSAFISSWLQKRRISDKEQFYSWRVVFDRTAFRGPYSWHSAQEPFIDAMKQTIRAINTGIVFHPGLGEDTVHRGKGKSQLRRAEWRRDMDQVERRLHNIVVVVEARMGGTPAYPDMDLSTVDIDKERDAVVDVMNGIWRRLNIPVLDLPTSITDIYTELLTNYSRSDHVPLRMLSERT